MAEFDPSTFDTHEEELAFLSDQGFPINPMNKKIDNLKDIWKYQAQIQKSRDSFQYPIDGLVVKVNDNKISKSLGAVGKTPRTWCAIKFPAEEKTTLLEDITWQVGRTGKLTPVAELQQVELAGTIVKRATLHNYKEFVESDLHIHDTLIVRKAGDIIPEVVQILDNLRDKKAHSFAAPASCPSCNTKLITSATDVDLVCPNTEGCHEQIKLRLSYYAQRNMANISGLSEKLIERFIREYGVHDIYDLYDLPWEKIKQLDRFGEKSATNLEAAIDKSRQQPDHKFFAALGIEGVGEEVAKLILKKIYALRKDDQS